MLVIIPCGNKKALEPKPAINLYEGSYFKACARYALSIAPLENIRILSAKHGLLKPDQIIEPYNLRLGQENAVSVEKIREQAQEQGILDEQEVIIAAGSAYARAALAVWPHGRWILDKVGGMGYQIQFLNRYKGVKNV